MGLEARPISPRHGTGAALLKAALDFFAPRAAAAAHLKKRSLHVHLACAAESALSGAIKAARVMLYKRTYYVLICCVFLCY